MVLTTGLYAALLGLLAIVLGALVVRQRLRDKVSLGYTDNETLKRRVRCFGNFSEYVPLALLLILLVELGGANTSLVHGLGSTLLLGRLAHPIGIMHQKFRYRRAGMLATVIAITGAAVTLLVQQIA
jgi:uncharacterized membrane protein YecN with MAPEG domain